MHLSSHLSHLKTIRLLVVGDLFLDEYVMGRAERLSREAPVPVLEYQSLTRIPGGGANPAMNAAALGAQVSVVGVVGNDPESAALQTLLSEAGIETDGLITDPSRPTITKTRIVAQGELRFPQQLVRMDRLSRAPLDLATQSAILSAISRRATAVDAILLSDYRSGLITSELANEIRNLPQAANWILTADTQGELDKYRGFRLVKCNRAEAETFLGYKLEADEAYGRAIAELQSRLNIQSVLITRGAHGLTIGQQGQAAVHIPVANATEVYDVTGAGDTVIAVATLALGAGASPVEAAQLANVAAGLVVRKWGNAVVTLAELKQALNR